jgi:16S rRNA (cytosine967-C5)-methyltransferase
MNAARADGTGAECRARAAEVLAAVLFRGRSLNDALPPALSRVATRDAALLQELCYGTLRWHLPARHLLGKLLHHPLPARESVLHALLLAGLYQLYQLRIPAYAAVAATVAATRLIDRPNARKLVNAVLRNAQRREDELRAVLAADPVLASGHPAWLLERLQQTWPEDWQAIVEADNAHPPMALRVNLARIDRTDYLSRLVAAGIAAEPDPRVPGALVLTRPCEVNALPGFADGLVSVQDPAAQLAAPLLDPQPGQRVLDACAAPGGKTGHLLEYAPDLDLLALDNDPGRLDRVRDNLDRLGLCARLVAGDAGRPEPWWDGKPFERILLDAPCTGSGVIRRHPDILVLRRPDDEVALAARQSALLDALWPLLAPDGRLLYATCSILPAETRCVVDDFLVRHGDAAAEPIAADWGRPSGTGRQLLPGDDNRDGFFYARLRKQH